MKTRNNSSAYVIRSAAWAGFLSFGFIALALPVNSPSGWHKSAGATSAYDTTAESLAQTRELTFAERVAYQRAIEDVYWHHRIWPEQNRNPKPSLDALMSQAQLENKVTDYLRNSQELEDHWHQPITAEQLQAEMDRMAQHTRQPEVLRELFAALGNDPFVIAECLARPLLAERLLSHRVSEQVTQIRLTDGQLSAATGEYSLPSISDERECTPDSWRATSATNGPSGRFLHTAVWTGIEMIIWGGGPGSLNTGGRYNPSTDSWTSTSLINAPVGRFWHTAIWTGSEMIIWGGNGGGSLNTGGKYNPVTNSWRATSTGNAPAARSLHTAVWTGSEMIVWGGSDFSQALNTGGRYDPSTDSWIAASTTNAPSGRTEHTAIWSGSDMIVWGGFGPGSTTGELNTGGRYHPITDSWTATSPIHAPTARYYHTAVWTGSDMIVWGGRHYPPGLVNDGGRYNPATDRWAPTSTTHAPSPRYLHTAIWTGSEMIVWGGGGGGVDVKTGGRYNPNTNSWIATSTTKAPTGRAQHTAIWTGSEMIVWGGGNYLNTGGRYCPSGSPAQLGNISTRAFVQTGDNVVIGGFMVQGTGAKRVIVRAIGPELTQYGIPNPLYNPTLELRDGGGLLIASNDNWQQTIIGGIITGNQAAEIRNSGHAPGDGRESAIIVDLAPGSYTAIVRGVNNITGVALVEVYDLSPYTTSILGNISTRSFVQTGDNAMIGGFIVQGTQPKRVMIRAIGPDLTKYGVPNVLANPALDLHDSSGALIASNDNWQNTIIGGIITSDQRLDIRQSGHAPGNALESAIIAELPAGSYTAVVRGVSNITGVALVEAYDLDH